MDNKDKHVRENEGRRLEAEGKNQKRESTRKMNNVWLWLGIVVLIFILLWWLFGVGTLEDLTGFFNG